MPSQQLRDLLIVHEGMRQTMYLDSVGVETIGIGHNLRSGPPLSTAAILQICDDDISSATIACNKAWPWFPNLDPVRQDVIVDLVFNMGIAGVSRFRKMIDAIIVADWAGASHEMLNSKWASQVGQRAQTLAAMMRTGLYP